MPMKYILYILALCLPLTAFAHEDEPEILANNRVLATVNGKAITVMDVMKKMDVFFARTYPELAKSPASRVQFFQQSWKQTLNQMVDQDLILADAEKMEMKITEGDIREEIHARFGPNVMASLDSLKMTYNEAWQMIHDEMAVQRMTWYRVHSKALQRIGPQDVKLAFRQWLKENPPKEQWKYQVLSIRSKTEKLGKVYAQKAHSLIRNEPLPFESLAKLLKDDNNGDISVTVSEEYNVEAKDLSESHKTILAALMPGSYSEPTPQVSRLDKSVVHRIFYLKDHIKQDPPKFDSKVEELQEDLLQKEASKEYPLYLAKLRKQFNFDEKYLESLPTQFQPFTLK